MISTALDLWYTASIFLMLALFIGVGVTAWLWALDKLAGWLKIHRDLCVFIYLRNIKKQPRTEHEEMILEVLRRRDDREDNDD